MMIYTTLNKIKAAKPCDTDWPTLLDYVGKKEADDDPLPVVTILDACGLEGAIWALQLVEGHDDVLIEFSEWCRKAGGRKFSFDPGHPEPQNSAIIYSYTLVMRVNKMERELRRILS